MEPRMGQPIQTPRDFEYLAACIVDRLHQSVSPSTLKRVWNYITTDCDLSQISDSPTTASEDRLKDLVRYSYYELRGFYEFNIRRVLKNRRLHRLTQTRVH